MDTPTTKDLDEAWERKQIALDAYRATRGDPAGVRQRLLDRYVRAVAEYETIRAQTSDDFFSRNPEFEAKNDLWEAFKEAENDHHDLVNSPSHYTSGDIECIEAIRSALGSDGFIAFARGNAMKYVWRMMDKHDSGVTDASKAMKYLEWIVDELEFNA